MLETPPVQKINTYMTSGRQTLRPVRRTCLSYSWTKKYSLSGKFLALSLRL